MSGIICKKEWGNCAIIQIAMVRGYKPLAEAVAIVIIKVISLKCSLAGIINLALAYVYVGGMFNYTKNTLQGNNANTQSDGFGLGGYASVLF